MTLQMYGTPDPAMFSGLGSTTLLGAAGAAALAALLGLNLADDQDWSSNEVFQANMRRIHSGMLALQCLIGGAQAGQPITDTSGSVLCAGGTKPICQLSSTQLAQWRSMRDNFSKFWSETMSSITLLTSTARAQGQQAKVFAADFVRFYNSIQATCAKQGVALPPSDVQPPPPSNPAPDWLKYVAWGAGAVAVIYVASAAKNIFGGQKLVLERERDSSPEAIRSRTAAAKKRLGLNGLGDMHMRRIQLDEEGRDDKGRTWGKGDPVFYIIDDATGIRTRLRARNAFDAANRFIEYLSDMHNLPRGLRRGARGW